MGQAGFGRPSGSAPASLAPRFPRLAYDGGGGVGAKSPPRVASPPLYKEASTTLHEHTPHKEPLSLPPSLSPSPLPPPPLVLFSLVSGA
jgi:hypothetical protein